MKKTRLYCAVPNCKSKARENIEYSYHRFPRSGKYKVNVTNSFGDVEEVDLYSQWKKVTNISIRGPNDLVCSRHFIAADFCRYGLRNLRRKLRRHAIPSLHLPIINKERHETNEKHTDIDIKVSESIQSTTETGKAAYNAETKQKYENNVPEPMEKDIKVFERVQSTNVHQITHQDNLQMDNKQKSNNVACEPSLYLQQPSVTGKSYKLLIQIDKVRARPGPKSKKRQLMTITTNHYKQLTQCQKIEKKDLNESIKKDDIIINLDTDSSCNSPEKNSTAIQDDVSIEKNLQCSICQKFFDSNRTLFMHKKTHMFCQYCGKQFDRKLLFDYHEKLHFSTDPTLPYKCHLCPTKFSDKQAIKVHNELFHTSQSKIKGDKSMVLLDNSFSEKFAVKQLKYQCEICKVFMKNEDSLRSHRASHEGEIKIPNGDITHKMNSKSNHERNTKYLCKVCCKEFETPAEAEAHTYTHVEIIETEHKCNICKKTFNSRQMAKRVTHTTCIFIYKSPMDSLESSHLRISRLHVSASACLSKKVTNGK